MARFVISSDFIQKFELSTGMYSNHKIDEYIDRYEDQYLIQLLGVELYNLFIADLDLNNIPQSDRFKKIFDPFNEQIGFSLMMSRGIKDMLIGFIYFEYLKDLITKTTNVGVTKPQEQNSKIITAHTTIYGRYNESIRTYNAIQEYILLSMNDYNEFKGVQKLYAYWL
jgi:hypothetical protein